MSSDPDPDAASPALAVARHPARGRAARMLVYSLAALALLELGLRSAAPRLQRVADWLRSSAEGEAYAHLDELPELLAQTSLGFQPGARRGDFILNRKSLRTKEYETAKQPGSLRVLAFGNSYTYACGGVPFEQLWHSRLRDALEAESGRPVELLNLGLPGTQVELQLRLWELEGSRLDADLVVLAFTIGGGFLAPARRDTRPAWVQRLSRWSFAFRGLANRFVEGGGVRLRATDEPDEEPEPAQKGRWTPEGAFGVPVAAVSPDFVYTYDPDHDGDKWRRQFLKAEKGYLRVCAAQDQELWYGPTARLLTRFRNAVEASGAEFVLMLIPAEVQVNEQLRRQLLKREGIEDELAANLELDGPDLYLREHCAREGIACLDLLSIVRAASDPSGYYGENNVHWNPAGNELGARQLFDFLTRPSSGEGRSLLERCLD